MGWTDVDAQTLTLAQAGNRVALGRFVEHYQDAVYGFLSRSLTTRRHRVDDLAQEVFLRAIRALPRFEQREARILTWLLQIAVRLLQDESRKKVELSGELIDEEPAHAPDPMQCALAREELTIVEQAAARLPEEQRVALVLQEFHGLSHAEIAQATGTTVATVKTRIHRARTYLVEALEQATGVRRREQAP
jgi:RNA polymerase sigma-70 factor, ECF subfamily